VSDHRRLLDHIASARWFGGKGRDPQLVGLSPLPWLRPPGDWPAVRPEIAEIAYPGGDDHEFYQLMISYRPAAEDDEPGAVTVIEEPGHGRLIGIEGVDEPAVRDALLGALLDPPKPEASVPSLQAHQVDLDHLQHGLPSRVFGGEQSNTSIMYAHVAMAKLFRRLEIGRNLDIETHEVLTRAGNSGVARLYGWLEGSWDAGDGSLGYGADLAMIVEQLAEARDGWEYALVELRTDADFSLQARRLGHALATIHQNLRTHFPTATLDGDQLVAVMSQRLDDAAAVVPQLNDHLPGLRKTFAALAGRRLEVQRVHGDFHLGQTLFTPSGWKIIDFEGEPAKTLAERSRPDSIWRDIAGALRSFDYAAAHRRDAYGLSWAAACRKAFLAGYGADLSDPGTAAMVRAYEADKAIYEVVYEARNRPDWVEIPLSAIAALATG
jgi:maltokinase